MLSLVLVEDEMRSMREASMPHRMRRITVSTCPVEPHHPGQSCGVPIWEGTRMLAGRLELPPITLPECGGWVVVQAAELSDDVYDGWRNAPCPAPDGGEVGSDGTGAGWEDSRFDPPVRSTPEPVPTETPEPVPTEPPPPTNLFDATGPFVFLYVDPATDPLYVNTFFLPYRMLGGTGCPADGDAVTLRPTVSVRGGANIVTGGTPGVPDTSVASWAMGMTNARYLNRPALLDSRFGWQGGAVVPVSDVWDLNPALELVGDGNDPSGLVPRPVYNKLGTRGLPPYPPAFGTNEWYVTDTLTFTWTQVSPAPPSTGYCVIALADCPSTGGVGSCG